MSIEEDNEETKELSNVIPFRRSGHLPPEPWLRGLKPGTHFLCITPYTEAGFLQQWVLIKHFERSTLLCSTTNSHTHTYVSTEIFSNENELYEIIGEEDFE